METNSIKPFSTTVTVKNVKFRCGPKGNILPLVILNENKDMKKYGVDSFMFNGIKVALDQGFLNKKAKLKVSFDEMLRPECKNIINIGESFIMPTVCESCDANLEVDPNKSNERICPNKFCPGTSLGFVYKLILTASPSTERSFVTRFIESYCVGGTPADIENLLEFQLAFYSIKSKNTQGRINQWKKTHKKDYELFWGLEMKIDEYLRSKTLKSSDFWNICNFPHISQVQLNELSSLNPSKFVKGDDNTYLKLSKNTRNYVNNNMDMVMFLEKFFNKLQEKTWTV